jgi:hypothetical protein
MLMDMLASNNFADKGNVILAARQRLTKRRFYKVAEATGSPVVAEALRRRTLWD